jgi:hypothetical protein
VPLPRGESAVLIGGGGWTRTNDLRIISCPPAVDSTQLKQDSSADSGKVLQNPQPPRNKNLTVPVFPPTAPRRGRWVSFRAAFVSGGVTSPGATMLAFNQFPNDGGFLRIGFVVVDGSHVGHAQVNSRSTCIRGKFPRLAVNECNGDVSPTMGMEDATRYNFQSSMPTIPDFASKHWVLGGIVTSLLWFIAGKQYLSG